MPPEELRANWTDSGTSVFVDSGVLMLRYTRQDRIVAEHVRVGDTSDRGSRAPTYKIMLQLDDGALIEPGGWGSRNKPGVRMTTYSFRAIEDIGTVRKLGLAVLTLDGRREAATAATARAQEVGAKVLPLPVTEEPLSFELLTMDDSLITSAELQGKVVLIDCWATWCGPCMAKMPQLKEVYAKLHSRGLEVIGINFDDDLAKAEAAIEELGIPWVEVHASSSAAGHDELWEQMAGITTLPRLFLIDRDGVLVDDFYPFDLAEQLAPYFEDADEE